MVVAGLVTEPPAAGSETRAERRTRRLPDDSLGSPRATFNDILKMTAPIVTNRYEGRRTVGDLVTSLQGENHN